MKKSKTEPEAEPTAEATEADLPEAEIVEEPELTPEEALARERDEYLDNWRRTQADIQNLRRRQAEVIESAVRGARRWTTSTWRS